MSVKAKCHNYTGCLLAYRGEEIEAAANGPMVCPDCGKPLTVVRSTGAGIGRAIALLLTLAGLGAIIYFALPYLKPYISSKTTQGPATTPIPTATPPKGGPSTTPKFTNSGPDLPQAEPPKTAVAPATIDLNVANALNSRTRDDVLKRIGQMPHITQENKDKLYLSVQRARSMGLLVTIPFASGNSRVAPADIPILKEELEKAPVMKLRDDATAVFVVLGYADPKGDEKKNLAISQQRADSVVEALREKCGIANVIHGVAMGGSRLIDANNLEKNRVAEIWAVRP
jgi:outer membrane protein OmpA-like peptidoglycan-associated protein